MKIESIFHTAQQFENTADLLAQQMSIAMSSPPVIPFVVNVTFSIEMYLKCLWVIESKKAPGQKEKIHDLHKLYGMLTEESRKEIKSEFDKLVQSSPYQNVANTPFETLTYDIDSVLLGMNKAFVNWRYLAFGMPAKSQIIKTKELINAIKKRINELHQF